MINVSVDANNTIAYLDELKGKTDKATAKGIKQAQIHLQRKVDENLKSGKFGIKTDGGRLAASITTSPVYRVGDSLMGIVGTNLKYARIQEEGGKTSAHVIRAKNADALHFFIGGKEIFRKSVNHPGSKIPAHWYMRKTMEEEQNYILDIIRFAQVEALK